jgi:hypothetical protein
MKLPKALDETHPPLAAANDTVNKINARTAALKASTAMAIQRIDANQPEKGNVEINAARAISGQPLLPEILPDYQQVDKNRIELSKLENARHMATANVQREKSAASNKLCAEVAPHHTALVKDMASALSAFQLSHTKYVDFLSALEDTGASNTSLNPVWPGVGHPRDTSGLYHWTFKEMRENGHISMNDIPKAVR